MLRRHAETVRVGEGLRKHSGRHVQPQVRDDQTLSCNVGPTQKLFALARVFGNIPDDLFSREYEQMIFRTVARAGMGPKLLVGGEQEQKASVMS